MSRTPGIPPVPTGTDGRLAQMLGAIRERLQTLGGETGSRDKWAVTYGVVQSLIPGADNLTAESPTAPTGVTCTPGMALVTVTWNAATYVGHAYAEVWKSSTNDIDTATLAGTASGSYYMDWSVGQGVTLYYWVRFVNVKGQIGSFNLVGGTVVTTIASVGYLMDILSWNGSGTEPTDIPFLQIASPMVINGVTVPAGTYIRHAMIYDGMIDNAKIGFYIQSVNFNAGLPMVPGWKMDKNGNITIHGGSFVMKDASGNIMLDASGAGVGLGNVVSSLNPITAANVSAYIQSLAVDTLYIANNAVTAVTNGYISYLPLGYAVFSQLVMTIGFTMPTSYDAPVLALLLGNAESSSGFWSCQIQVNGELWRNIPSNGGEAIITGGQLSFHGYCEFKVYFTVLTFGGYLNIRDLNLIILGVKK